MARGDPTKSRSLTWTKATFHVPIWQPGESKIVPFPVAGIVNPLIKDVDDLGPLKPCAGSCVSQIATVISQ